MFFIAEEVREYMAQMGFRTVKEMIGQTQMLEFQNLADHWKARHLDLSPVLAKPRANLGSYDLYNVATQDHGLDKSLDQTSLIPAAQPPLESKAKVTGTYDIVNINRTVGTTLSGMIAKKYGQGGLPEDTIVFNFKGSAGQSFGCFGIKGLTLLLEGDANDYVGKGLNGAKIAVRPAASLAEGFKAEHNIIAGNTCLYGAIDGEAYLRGVAGERFAVRNSGAHAVVEGVGDHGCEYMTGGKVIVIGQTGRNFAAGMSGGVAYVYDGPMNDYAGGQFPSSTARKWSASNCWNRPTTCRT